MQIKLLFLIGIARTPAPKIINMIGDCARDEPSI